MKKGTPEQKERKTRVRQINETHADGNRKTRRYNAYHERGKEPFERRMRIMKAQNKPYKSAWKGLN